MNALKIIFTFFLALLISSSVFAFSQEENTQNIPDDPILVENQQVSLANAVSLFNFITLAEVKKDTTEYNSTSGNSRMMELIQAFF